MKLREFITRLRERNGVVVVDGERGPMPSANTVWSRQSRATSWLAIGAIGVVAAGAFAWWNFNGRAEMQHAEAVKAKALAMRAESGMKPRGLGQFAAKMDHGPAPKDGGIDSVTARLAGDKPKPPGDITQRQAGGQQATPSGAVAAPAAPPKRTTAELDRDLALSSTMAKRGKGAQAQAPEGASSASLAAGLLKTGGIAGGAVGTTRLTPERSSLLRKGTSIDCTLVTAIVSTLPGMTICVGSSIVYSADGTPLLGPGTVYTGRYQSEVKTGQNRIGVIWTEAQPHDRRAIDLNSPGTDSLGRAGLEGWTDTHFWDRFGAALMVSLIETSIQAVGAAQGGGGGATAISINPSGTGNIATEILKSTISIPPTNGINQGERIQILVAQDIPIPPPPPATLAALREVRR